MNSSIKIALSFVCLIGLELNSIAQPSTITTHAGTKGSYTLQVEIGGVFSNSIAFVVSK